MAAKYCIVDCEHKMYLAQPGIAFTASISKAILFTKFSGAMSHLNNVKRSSYLSQVGVKSKYLQVILETSDIPDIEGDNSSTAASDAIAPPLQVEPAPSLKKPPVRISGPEHSYVSMTEYFSSDETSALLGKTLDALKELATLYPSWADMRKNFEDGQKTTEAKLCDIYHKIEFSKENVVGGYKLYQLLRETLIERRKMKDAITFLDAIDTSNARFLIDAYNGVTKVFNTKHYNPRALPELFQDIA